MAKAKVSSKSKRRLFLFGTLSIIMIGYFGISAVTYAFNLTRLSKEEKFLNEQLMILKSQEQDLKNEIQKLQDPDYVARYARENYLYSKDGEYIIKIKPNEVAKEDKQKKGNPILYQYLIAVIVLLTFLMIVVLFMKSKKKKEAK